jgi:salicylate hydroxylase
MARTTETPSQPLVIVVGAGLGGLAAGIAIRLTGRYAVLVLESAAELQEIGAGIQVSPNCTRLLERWGIARYLEGKAVMPACSRVCRWRDGAILSQARVGEDLQARFGAPYWHVHRADLHSALLRRLEDLGGVLRTASHVVDANTAGDYRGQSSVTLRTGEVLACDFVVGADGLRSKIREVVVVPEFGAMPRRPVITLSALPSPPRSLLATRLLRKWRRLLLRTAGGVRGGTSSPTCLEAVPSAM